MFIKSTRYFSIDISVRKCQQKKMGPIKKERLKKKKKKKQKRVIIQIHRALIILLDTQISIFTEGGTITCARELLIGMRITIIIHQSIRMSLSQLAVSGGAET